MKTRLRTYIIVISAALALAAQAPAIAQPTTMPPPSQRAPTPAVSPSPTAQAQASKQDGGQQPDAEALPDFFAPTAPLAEPGSSTPKQKVLVTEVNGPSPGADIFRLHYKLAQKLKEKGHEITVVGNPQREYRISVAGGPIQNLGTLKDIIGMTPDKWIAEDKVNIADYGMVLAAGDRPVASVYQAQALGKLIVNGNVGEVAGSWVLDRDKKAAAAAEKEYLKAQADKGYLQQNNANKFWRNAPWWDEEVAMNAIKNGPSMAGLSKLVVTAKDGVTSITVNSTFGAMRPCDVAAWKNVVSYNVNPSEDRRGYDGMRGYSSAALDKFASEILCPAVERAIQTHKEVPVDTSRPNLAKASYLPPRPSLPRSFPLERPKREGKVVCSGEGHPATAVAQQVKARAVPDNLRAVQIACSYRPTTCLALKPDGTVVAWGNDASICNVPAGLTNVVQVALGDGEGINDLAAALRDNGTVVVWGKGAEELQCDLSGIVQIVVGNGQVIGLKADGTITAVQPKDPRRHRSNLASIEEPLVQISGGRIPLGLTCEGKVVALRRSADSDFYIPSELGEVASLADCHNSQAQQSAVILIDGTVASWGRNDVGQASVPDGLSDVVQLSAGNDTTFAVKRDGALVGWGSNWNGQLQIPQAIKKAIQVAAGSDVTLAIVED